MYYTNFNDLEKAVDRLCDEQRFSVAYDMLSTGLKALPPSETKANEFLIAWKRAALCTMCKEYEECLLIIGARH